MTIFGDKIKSNEKVISIFSVVLLNDFLDLLLTINEKKVYILAIIAKNFFVCKYFANFGQLWLIVFTAIIIFSKSFNLISPVEVQLKKAESLRPILLLRKKFSRKNWLRGSNWHPCKR